MRRVLSLVAVVATPAMVAAQAAKSAPAAPSAPLTESQQIASAMLALPTEFRDGARVLGYRAGGKELVPIRDANGQFTCLATEPGKSFHVACYQNSMEPFMLRGRELRAAGREGSAGRHGSIRRGEIGQARHAQAARGDVSTLRRRIRSREQQADGIAPTVRHLHPGRDAGVDGIERQAIGGIPWIMFAGTPKAHIMLTPKM